MTAIVPKTVGNDESESPRNERKVIKNPDVAVKNLDDIGEDGHGRNLHEEEIEIGSEDQHLDPHGDIEHIDIPVPKENRSIKRYAIERYGIQNERSNHTMYHTVKCPNWI
mmetsp:Transcript_45325/g.109752  ORF Transcript_45325/g.109752 Transcript_45325/m.109752 type:complete len:110 (-) Transcript_45325:1084-1413(-)